MSHTYGDWRDYISRLFPKGRCPSFQNNMVIMTTSPNHKFKHTFFPGASFTSVVLDVVINTSSCPCLCETPMYLALVILCYSGSPPTSSSLSLLTSLSRRNPFFICWLFSSRSELLKLQGDTITRGSC